MFTREPSLNIKNNVDIYRKYYGIEYKDPYITTSEAL